MKVTNAIEIITNAVQTDGMTIEQDKALSLAQKALEKQILRKTVVSNRVIHHCPNCNDVLNDIFKPSFCGRCGQALDWSDAE